MTRWRKISRVPFFPIVPFVPLAIVGGLLAIEAFTLRRLRKLAHDVDTLVAAQTPQPHAS